MTPVAIPPITDHLPIALRAYAIAAKDDAPERSSGKRKRPRSKVRASAWILTFDTETTTDAGQSLRFGAYQVRHAGELKDAGLFYAADGVTADELDTLRRHADAHGLRLLSRDDFANQVVFGVAWKLRATIIGFNLPFDISRIAIGHGSARTSMRGGFTFKLSDQKIFPRVQVRHLSQRMAFIRFAATMRQPDARSARKRGQRSPHRAGHFVDVKTLAAALLSRSFSLAGLSDFLNVEHPKLDFDDFDRPVTDDMVAYAMRDVQATWECFVELNARLDRLSLPDALPEKIYSEASLGKAYVRAMGVTPWRQVQPDFPAQATADILGTYYGGRSEVRIRRELRQVVLCDFLSMYPTVCTLMGLWRFVIADGMTGRDATAEVRARLDAVTVETLRSQAVWRELTTLVRVVPDGDVFPVRAAYSGEGQTTIGLNHLTTEGPMWFTLADCLAAKLLTGKMPQVVEAVAYAPGPPQADLRPIDIAGNPEFRVDPATTDFFKRMIELRQSIKSRRDAASGEEREALDVEQNALKIAANSTSYGIYVEVNVSKPARRRPTRVYSSTGEPFDTLSPKVEEPGPFFHPLLATLITGAARLMLALAERLVADRGVEWSFCDTDSMAIAKPDNMTADAFHAKVAEIVEWFAALNPYAFGGSILKVERVNAALDDAGRSEPLFCWAVSAKRYALFNIGDDGSPVMRKVSGHGLGHWRAPYDATDPAPGIPPPDPSAMTDGVALWHVDLWRRIVEAALGGHPDQVARDHHPALTLPAISRYAATTPDLLRWFNAYNRNRAYRDQVKPFGFLLAMSARQDFEGETIVEKSGTGRRRSAKRPKPISCFDLDFAKAAASAFNRETGAAIPASALKSYAEALVQYHVQSETKFLNGGYLEQGGTVRRHVQMTAARHIGKESNNLNAVSILGHSTCKDAAITLYNLRKP